MRATLFQSKSPWETKREKEKAQIFPLARAILTVYLIASISFRVAFVPEFELNLVEYPGFVVLDLTATIVFTYETIRIARLTSALLSPQSILPVTSDHSKDGTSLGHSLRSHDDSVADIPAAPRTFWSYLRVAMYFMSTIPLEYLTMIFSDGGGGLANFLLLNRLLRALFLPKYLKDMATMLSRRGYLRNIGVRRTFFLFFTMALAGHLCGCVFFLVARWSAESGVALTWAEVAGLYSLDATASTTMRLTMKATAFEAYITSLYWAYITMITTGFGDVVPLHINETVWCTFSMFIGVMITALSIANLQTTIGQFDAARLQFQRKMELIKKFLLLRGIGSNVQERVMSFYDYQWQVLRGAQEEQYLMELPHTLQQQVTNFMLRDIIAMLPILRRANKALLNALVESAEMNIYSPGDDIIKSGEKIRGCILVARGEVEVVKGTKTERKMKRLDRYGEECLFADKVSEHDVKSKGFTEVITIPRIEFQRIIHSQCDKEDIERLWESAATLSKATVKANKLFGSGDDITPSSGFQKHCHPCSFFRKLWDCIVLGGLMFYIISLPLSFMHLVENTSFGDTPVLLSLGYAVDCLFLLDAVLEWNFFFYMESGLLVFDRDHIRQHYYQRHNVAREIFCLIPFDIATAFLGGSYGHYFRLAKIVRIPNIAAYMESVEVMLAELKISIDLALYRVLKLNVIMLVVCHIVGCMWYMMASLSISLGYSQNWRYADESNDIFSVSHSDFGGFAAYLRSVYWAIVGMSTVGYGDIVPTNTLETTFATVVILFGGLVLPAVVGGLAAYISNLRMTAKLFRKKVSKVRLYLLKIKVDAAILDKCSTYYDYHWSCQGGVVESEVMDELPLTLRNVISAHANGAVVKSCPFLQRSDDATRQMIVTVLQPRLFMPGDSIIQEGEKGFEMYFLKRGRVAVSTSSIRAPLRILSNDDFFGESCLLESSLSTATLQALTYCECFSLNKDDFNEAMITSSSSSKQIQEDLARCISDAKDKNQRASQNLSGHPKCAEIMVGQASESRTSTSKSPVLLPGSQLLLAWNFVLLLLCVYMAVVIPFSLAFDTHGPMIMDRTIDVIFLLDMMANYHIIAYIRQGELILDRNKIHRNYINQRLKVDLISTIPFDIIARYALPDTPVAEGLLRTLKMSRFGRHFGTLDDFFGFLSDHQVSLAGLRLLEFLSGVVLIAHWAACGFFFIARVKSNQANCSDVVASTDMGNCLWAETWLSKQVTDGKLPSDGGVTWQHYIRSFNWALPTLVVVVIGDVVPTSSPETLYAFLLMALGVTVNAAIVGNVANIVANLESDSADFARKVDEIRNYMHKHKLRGDLFSRVDDFTRYLWTSHGGSTDEDSFILSLPDTLQTDVIQQTRTKLLLRCPMFDLFSNETIRALALCLKPRQFSSGDVIVHAGDFGQSMFFIEAGTVQVVPNDGLTVLATLRAGSFFGESSLFTKKPRASSVCAVNFCDVFQLEKSDLFHELKRRDMDVRGILKTFSSIFDMNSHRNDAIQKNLRSSKSIGTKLSKIIVADSESKSKSRAVLDIFYPESRLRYVWDILCLVLIVYFSIFVLFRMAFGESRGIVVFDIAADAFFIVDLYLRSTHFAFTRNGQVCTDRKLILRNYMKSGMLLDVISSMAVLQALIPMPQIRLLSLLRTLRMPSFIKKVQENLSLQGIRISLATNLSVKIICFYAIANHWVACLWFIIHRFLERNTRVTWATSDCPWNDEGSCLAKWDDASGAHNICNMGSMLNCYSRALHFALTTLSTVGYGDISPASELETIFENVVVLVGACFLAGIIGAFGAFLTEQDTLGLNSFKKKLEGLKQYMNYRNIPREIQSSILFFHHCRWKDSQTLDERETLRILPQPLQLDISYAVKQKVIRSVPILDSLPSIVQKRIAHSIRAEMYSSQDHPIIYSHGDIGWEIYFIFSGVVQITLPTDVSELDKEGRHGAAANKEKYTSLGFILSAGNHVGELCISSESGVRQETVTAIATTVELYALSKNDLDSICRLMGSEKGRQLRHSLLSRNRTTWHTFSDIDAMDSTWDDDSNITRERQSSNSTLSWAVPPTASRPRRSTRVRRRRSSVGVEQMSIVMKE